MALRFVNGSNQYVLASSATLHNLNPATYMMWVNLTTIAPAAQRNFSGKSTAANRVVTFITGTNLTVQAGGGTLCQASALVSNFAWARANQWMFLVFQYHSGGAAASQRILVGTSSHLASEPSAYANQDAGVTKGDDSGAGLYWANASGGGTTNTLPGDIAPVHVVNRLLTNGEIWQQQRRARPVPGTVHLVGMGDTGTSLQLDQSHYGTHGTVTGATWAPTPAWLRPRPTKQRRAFVFVAPAARPWRMSAIGGTEHLAGGRFPRGMTYYHDTPA